MNNIVWKSVGSLDRLQSIPPYSTRRNKRQGDLL